MHGSNDAHVGTAALGRPCERSSAVLLAGALRQNFGHDYRSERTSNSVSSEMIASAPHAANSRMRSA